jgi:CubicO group peptidase (beta-lactamase class C family)
MTTDRILAAAEACRAAARMGGLVLAVAHGDGPPESLALGADAAGAPLAADSLFITASVTKLATALAALRLADAGTLDLGAELGRYLPDAAAAQPGITVARVMSHSAGLPVDVSPERAPYAPGLSWDVLRDACLAEPPAAAPGGLVQYGNHGYGLLAIVVERLAGAPFPQALRELVLAPLGIAGDLGAGPTPAVLSDVRGNNLPELQPFNSAFYRSLALPWAGLVTTAAGALALARAFAGRPAGFISPAVLGEARRSHTDGLEGGSAPPLWYDDCPWGLGPELRGVKRPHWAPASAAPASYGHAGASGCIAWHDPASDVSYAIMGTRTAANGWLIRHAPTLGDALLADLTPR